MYIQAMPIAPRQPRHSKEMKYGEGWKLELRCYSYPLGVALPFLQPWPLPCRLKKLPEPEDQEQAKTDACVSELRAESLIHDMTQKTGWQSAGCGDSGAGSGRMRVVLRWKGEMGDGEWNVSSNGDGEKAARGRGKQ
jgi:hypothetical protein